MKRKLFNKISPIIYHFVPAKTKRLIKRRQGFGEYLHLNKVFSKIEKDIAPYRKK